MLTIKQCPTCKQNVSFNQFKWIIGAKLPKDCPWCNKTMKKKEEKTRHEFHEELKPKYHSWLKKGA